MQLLHADELQGAGALSGPAPDILYIRVNGAIYSGWMESRVTRGIERFPSDFDVAITETFPGQAVDVIAKPGDPCTILLGSSLVMTGYVDRYMVGLSPETHSLRITGRGKCQDLADCAAIVPNNMLTETSVLRVANQLVAPFLNITATSLSGDGTGQPFSQVVNLGETPYDILEVLARYEGLLLYEDEAGNLVFSTVGTNAHSSGFTEGVNVQAASAMFSMDERFSEYRAATMSTDRYRDVGSGGNLIATVYDKSVPRYRPRVIVTEQIQNGNYLAELRANWELARRRGRSQQIGLTVDSWYDSAGRLWQPNYLVPVDMPSCKVVGQSWVIAEVSYMRGADSGTTAQLTLMPPEAFNPEPAATQTLGLQVTQSIREGPS